MKASSGHSLRSGNGADGLGIEPRSTAISSRGGLTKLNYNTCKLGDSEPVTVGFSDAVGEILVSNPKTVRPNPSFKFYI